MAEARRPPPALPLCVLTGFLGSGKTTLLNRMLQDPSLAHTLVIINEFGDIGLDHLFVEAIDDNLMLMQAGCLCCSIRGDLVTTLEGVLRDLDNHRIASLDRIIIETTGLADPAPILQTIMLHPYLMLRLRLDSVITLVDAVNGLATLDAHVEALRQVAVADRVVLTKTDLLPDGPATALLERLASLNPAAKPLVLQPDTELVTELLNAGLYDPARKHPDVAGWLKADAYDHHHHHHDRNRHNARIRAFCLTSDKPATPAAFDMFIELLRQAHGPKLLRVKGIVALADDPSRPLVVHGVQHVFHPPVRLAAWPDDNHATRMVFILMDLPPAFVEGLWRAFTGEAETDRPDGAALRDNPLLPGKGGLLS